MVTRRQRRISEFIQQEISELLAKKSQDPRLSSVTITHVEMTADLQLAKVLYSVLGDGEAVKEAAVALHHARSFLRREIAPHLTLRHTPDLRFVLDDSWERGARVDALLEQIAHEQEEHERTS